MTIQQYTIESISEFLNSLSQQPTPRAQTFFRGHADESWKLIPSVGRFKIKPPEGQKETVLWKEYEIEYEKQILMTFRRQAPPYLDSTPRNDLEWLLLAQHHGLPTRLLDWTANPLVALYFAVENLSDTTACVCQAVNPDNTVYSQINGAQSMEQATKASSEFDHFNGYVTAFFLLTSQHHRRYTNQSSVVSFHSNPKQEFSRVVYAEYIIRANQKEKIKRELSYLGINQVFIYQTLDSVAQEIKQSFSFLLS